MKSYTEYTKKELAVLTQEDIETLISYELAKQGVKPVMKPVMQPVPEVNINPEVEVYESAGIIFGKMADAIEFLRMERYEEEYEYGGIGDQYKWLRNPLEYKQGFQPVRYYSKAQIESVRETLMEIKRVNQINDKAQREWVEYLKSTASIREEVLDAYREAQTLMKDIEDAKRAYSHYLSLAEGDEKIAKNFFWNAYHDDFEIIEELFPEMMDRKNDASE